MKSNFVNICFNLVVLLLLFKFNTVSAQPVSFSLNSTANLNLVYQTENDFETERVVNNAFRLELRGRNTRMMVSAKTISTLNFSFTSIPVDIFSIRINSTNYFVSGNDANKLALDFSDRNILYFQANNNRNYYFNYNLYYQPIGYEYEPGNYFYSVIFTITEL